MIKGARIAGRAGTRRSDGALAGAARAGDDRAFAALYERHAPAIFDFLARTVRDIPAAEDLLQATFLRALEHRQELRDPARVRAWLFSIAYWLAVNHLSRTPPPEPVEERELAWPGPGAESLVTDQEAATLVSAAATLERRQYAVLDLAVRRELSTPEIAQVLGVTPGHASVLVYRAKRSLGSAVRTLLITRSRPSCERLAGLVPAGEHAFTAAQRTSVDHHLRRCQRCKHLASNVVDEALLAGLPPVALPAHLVHAGWAPALGHASRTGPTAPTARGAYEAAAAAYHRHPAAKLLARLHEWTVGHHAQAARAVAAVFALGAGAGVALGLTSGGSAPAKRATPVAATTTTPPTTPTPTHKLTKPKSHRPKQLSATPTPTITSAITIHPTPSPHPKKIRHKPPKTTPTTPKTTTKPTKTTTPTRPTKTTTTTTPSGTTTTPTTPTTTPTTPTTTLTTPTTTTTTPTTTTTTTTTPTTTT